MEENKCVCRDCEKHCECEIHKLYEDTNCENGKNPISYCEMKNKSQEE